MDFNKRKPNRLKNYDYSGNGAYFITICTQNRKSLLWQIVGASIARPSDIVLSPYGEITDKAIQSISEYYPCVYVDNYVIMPNHIHLLLRIDNNINGRPMVAPTISTVIQQMKGYITKKCGGKNIWQKLFHDHVIRNENDYKEIWEYIEHNPEKWKEDCFYTE